MPTLTHLDEEGRVRMVDVSEKAATAWEAVAQGIITMQPETFDLITEQKVKKGNVLETARFARIMAATRFSIDLARRRTNMTLVGRVRQERMVVYNHGGRIAGL